MRLNEIFIHMIVLTAVGMFISCKKENIDATPPSIVIQEPAPNDTIAVTGVEVHVEFVVSDDDRLQSVDVRVVVTATDSVIFTDTPGVSGLKTFSYHDHFAPVATDLTRLRLTVTAKDVSNNRSDATVLFSIRP